VDDGPPRTFRVEVLDHNQERKEFLVRLTVWNVAPPVMELQAKPFHLGPFDFPLIDNMRAWRKMWLRSCWSTSRARGPA
jgi:hypothetical protein